MVRFPCFFLSREQGEFSIFPLSPLTIPLPLLHECSIAARLFYPTVVSVLLSSSLYGCLNVKKVIERRNQKYPPLFSLLIIVSGRQMFGIAKILGGSFFFFGSFFLCCQRKKWTDRNRNIHLPLKEPREIENAECKIIVAHSTQPLPLSFRTKCECTKWRISLERFSINLTGRFLADARNDKGETRHSSGHCLSEWQPSGALLLAVLVIGCHRKNTILL